ncbi:MFS transporter [Helicobacter sp. 11S03491-1]|uniref:MFS transporter n=1 Tax=Helicobacter sp. 11S03491-1 TaxID=1476196 RepID=UPI000BA50E7C|nr:MFS transporter [Helicobacter sp. 11S03491-1]PAF43320.1 hypothetical protein BKH45_01385 [Helicobacter sp. 11S03491-1]
MQKSLLNFLFALACGVIVANLYYAQPILSQIANSLNIGVENIAFITTITQVGYALGMFFLVPLLDILENKKLIISIMILNVIALFLTGFSQNFLSLLAVFLMVGISASSVQMIVPFGASMVPENIRGATVGRIMSGLLFGIMLARPISSFLSGQIGWSGVFIFSATLGLLLVIAFLLLMPTKQPMNRINYFKLLTSMVDLFLNTALLRQRGFYHFLAFGAFCLFWIVSPLVLIEKFHFNTNQVALFALIGVVGALIAPIAGRLADSGRSEWATKIALLSVGLAMILAGIPIPNAWGSIFWLGICGIILDFGVSLNLVIGQRIIYTLGDNIRARLNALYMVMFFIGGALGSYLGAFIYVHWGYSMAFLLGGFMGLAALFLFRWNLRKNH